MTEFLSSCITSECCFNIITNIIVHIYLIFWVTNYIFLSVSYCGWFLYLKNNSQVDLLEDVSQKNVVPKVPNKMMY